MGKFEDALKSIQNGQSEQAIALLNECSEQNDYRASYQLGNFYLSGTMVAKDENKAKDFFLKSFEQIKTVPQTSETEFLLGTFYLFGLGGITIDKTKAISHISKAAAEGNFDAIVLLSNCYRTGNGIEKDVKKSFEIIENAAKSGHPLLVRLLADSYYFAQGVEQNYELALKYYKDASDKGDVRATFTVGTCYFEGKGVAKDEKIALEYFIKAGMAGVPDAMKNTAYFYGRGIGTEQDYHKEAEWLERYANTGSGEGMFALASCYLDKKHGLFRYIEAIEYLKKAVEKNYIPAFITLGHIYEHSLYGVLPQHGLAFKYYNTAYENGYKNAAVDLIRCFKLGIGVKANEAKVRELEAVLEEIKNEKAHEA